MENDRFSVSPFLLYGVIIGEYLMVGGSPTGWIGTIPLWLTGLHDGQPSDDLDD